MTAVASPAATDPGKAWRAEHGIPVVPAFDGFRALAISAIVLFHVLQVSGVVIKAGHSAGGVLAWGLLPQSIEALFIVSGFVIYLPTVARGGDFGRVVPFGLRRAARLVPGYYVALALAVVLLLTVPRSPGVPGAGPILLHVAGVHTVALLFDGAFPLGLGVIAPVWTLTVELGFYLVLPLVAGWYYRRPFLGLGAAAALLVVWRELAWHSGGIAHGLGVDIAPTELARIHDYYASQFPSWALALASGMTAAWLYVRLRDRAGPRAVERWAPWGAAAALAAYGAFVYLAGHGAIHPAAQAEGVFATESVAVALGYPLSLAAFLLAVSLGPRWLQRPFANPLMSRAADVSYGVYLIHFAVIFFCLHEFAMLHDGSARAALLWIVIVFPVSFAYGALSARFVERPVRRWAHRFGRRSRRPRAYAAA